VNTQTVKQLYIEALWWSVIIILTIVPWAISVLIIEEGLIRYAALPLSILLPVTFGVLSDKLFKKEEVVLQSKVYEKGM